MTEQELQDAQWRVDLGVADLDTAKLLAEVRRLNAVISDVRLLVTSAEALTQFSGYGRAGAAALASVIAKMVGAS